MSPELSDLENPIMDLDTTIRALHAFADAAEGPDSEALAAVLFFLAKNLSGIRDDLHQKRDAALAADRGGAPPLHEVH